ARQIFNQGVNGYVSIGRAFAGRNKNLPRRSDFGRKAGWAESQAAPRRETRRICHNISRGTLKKSEPRSRLAVPRAFPHLILIRRMLRCFAKLLPFPPARCFICGQEHQLRSERRSRRGGSSALKTNISAAGGI